MKRIKIFSPLFLLACLFGVCAGPAGADIFYSVSNYATGSAGVVLKTGGGYEVRKNLVSNLGRDAAGFTFADPGGDRRAMVREYEYGPNDTVYIWNPSDWKKPIVNTNGFGSNIHAAASDGRYLYLTTYESYAGASSGEDTGEVARVDMNGGYTRDRAYRYERFTSAKGNRLSPRGEALHVRDGKVYALFGMPYNGVTEYEASEIVEFDPELNLEKLRSVRLADSSGAEGKNAVRMAYYGGKLYAACMGGFQGPDSWGDLWEIDIAAMTARRVLDGRDIPYTVNGKPVNVGLYAVDFAPNGTAFVLAGSYDESYTFRARLFVTTAARLSAGDAGEVKAEYRDIPGESWDLLWDEPAGTLWCMTGTGLEARDKNGSLLRAFTARELGDNIYTVSLLNGVTGGIGGGGDGDGENSGGGSGGGCDAGVWGLTALTALAALGLRYRRRRLTHFWVLLLALALASGPALAAPGTSLYPVRFRVTRDAGIRVFHKTLHFYPFTEYPLAKTGTEGDYDIYTGELPSTFHYEAGGRGREGEDSGFLKQAQVIGLKDIPDERLFTVDPEPLDPDRREDNGFKGDGVYFNVNDARHLELAKGETFKLLPIRVWQAEEGVTENYFIEPDYDIEVLGDKDAVGYEWKGVPGSRYAELRGLAEGLAVLRISYDPIKLIHRNGEDSTYFNAIEPAETGIVAVSVSDTDTSAAADIRTNIAAREYDTIYFDKDKADHAEYVFSPSAAGGGGENDKISVRVHRPIHKGGAEWGRGWSDGRPAGMGDFAVNLYEGRNIVEVAFKGRKKYHVIDAKGVTVSVTNRSDAAWRPGGALRPGDELEISFGGIKTPLEKIAAIYNPGFPDTCYVSYRTQDGGEARSEGVQYNLSEKNAVKVTVPASGAVRLTGGVIYCGHMGDPLGSHRDEAKVLGNGLTPNFNATAVPPGPYSVLPDIALGGETDAGKSSGGGGCDAGVWGLTAFVLAGALMFIHCTREGVRHEEV